MTTDTRVRRAEHMDGVAGHIGFCRKDFAVQACVHVMLPCRTHHGVKEEMHDAIGPAGDVWG